MFAGDRDLQGRTIATVAGTTSVEAARQYGDRVVEVPMIEEACERLLSQEVEAVVFDSASLLYYMRTNSRLGIHPGGDTEPR